MFMIKLYYFIDFNIEIVPLLNLVLSSELQLLPCHKSVKAENKKYK